MQIKKGKYTHYKGKDYEVLGEVLHSETEEWMVLYKPLYEFDDLPADTQFVRPKAMFTENVTVDGQDVPRFRFAGVV